MVASDANQSGGDPARRAGANSGGVSPTARAAIRLRRRRRANRSVAQASGWRGWRLALAVVAVVSALLVGAAALTVYLVYVSYAEDLEPPEAIEPSQRQLGSSRIYDRDGVAGTLLFEFAHPLLGLRDPVRLHRVSQHMIDATVATEDASFWTNRGINERGLLRAAWENFGVGSSEFLGGSGGSSITQQLVKNVLIPFEERSGRTWNRVQGKIKETILAVELTQEYGKEQILEWYLNTIYYGNLAYGIGAASQRYFGKSPAELTLAEAALLAGLPQAPSEYNPLENYWAAKRRQAVVLDLMARHGYIDREQAEAAKAEQLEFDTAAFEIEAPHFVLYVRAQVEALCEAGRFEPPLGAGGCSALMDNGGLRITTTLDFALQAQAERVLRAAIADFEEETDAHNGAIVAIEPQTGQIRVMVGSRDFFEESIDGQVNLATALHSPGSSIKPLTYLAAFELEPRIWHPATILWDVPTVWVESDGAVFEPTNYDGRFRGPVTVRSALANSMNVPAFKTAAELGTPYLLDTLHRVGISTMHEATNYGPSLTLGGGEVSLLDMTYAYAVLGAGGVMAGHPTLLDLPDGHRALDPVAVLAIHDSDGNMLYEWTEPERRAVARPGQVYQITDILSDNDARALLYGTQSNLVLDRPVAAKTGTAGDPGIDDVRRDYWTMGYTPQLAVGVWVGNADESPMRGGSSASTAGLVWRNVMIAAHRSLPVREFVEPQGMERRRVYAPQIEPLRMEPGSVLALRDPCDRIVTELFVSARVAPSLDNGICYQVGIDRRTHQRATVRTPRAFVERGVWLEPPMIERNGARVLQPAVVHWLEQQRVVFLRPGAASESHTPLRIDAPLDGATVQRGEMLITGRVHSGDLISWKLTAYHPDAPAPILLAESNEPASGGVLARWDTANAPGGVYVLRLELVDGWLGLIEHEIFVRLPDVALEVELAADEAASEVESNSIAEQSGSAP